MFWLPADRSRRAAGARAAIWSALLALTCQGCPSALAAQEADDALRERLFVVRAEQPGVPLRVTSLRGGDVYKDSTDKAGMMVFRLRVADEDEIRFIADSDRWQLDWVQKVRNAHLDPDIPLELDVGTFLQRVEPKQAAEQPAEADLALSCHGADDIQCLRRLQSRLAGARRRGDCPAALALAQRLTTRVPDFAASDPAAVELANLNFECALIEAAQGDPHAREELLLRRAVALAAGEDGAGWCHPQRSRILAAAHAELRDTASAAASVRRARVHCPDSPLPVEWEFYFRLGLGQVGLAAEVADGAASRPEFAELGLFLRGWAQYAAGTCPLAARWVGATPCSVLPDGACDRARTRWVLGCADDEQLAIYAEQLRRRLDDDAEATDPQRRQTLEDLAEMESARGEPAAAAELFAQLQERPATDARRGLWSCRQGDALLRAGRPADALQAFERASSAWADLVLSVSRLDRLVVENNVLILGSGVRGGVEAGRLDSLWTQLQALEDEAERPWRLAVENNLLELRTRAEAERAGAGPATARDALERLRSIESDYRRHVQSVDEIGGDAEMLRACSILAFAGDLEQKVENDTAGERE